MQLTTSEEEVEAMCVAAAEARTGGFKTIAQALEKTDEFVEEFFVGGTDWNMKTEDGEGNYRLKARAPHICHMLLFLACSTDYSIYSISLLSSLNISHTNLLSIDL